jgi:hypothetical protein
MNQEKRFDCVEMKTEIQETLLREAADLGEGRGAQATRRAIAARPHTGRLSA